MASERPRCSAHRTNGSPCRNYPINGGNVCVSHGGRAPQVRAKATQRLLEAADPVAAELIRLALNAESESVRVSAGRDVLDRAGLAAYVRIEHSGPDGEPIQFEAEYEISERVLADPEMMAAMEILLAKMGEADSDGEAA